VHLSLQTIEHALAHHRPRKKALRAILKRSAVAMILREQGRGAEILMIKRAERRGDPWSGHMAFPGGRMESHDRHGLDVATRETHEEIGLRLGDRDPCIGRLSEIMTHLQLKRRPMVVSPYLFRLDRTVSLEPNHEVAEVIWVPLDFLRDRGNREIMHWQRGRVPVPLPCYYFRGRRIWGLSLMMLDELLAILPKGGAG
jgi:8-oxo-dGTP pyrophosphatase MutT (NUDIX family)